MNEHLPFHLQILVTPLIVPFLGDATEVFSFVGTYVRRDELSLL